MTQARVCKAEHCDTTSETSSLECSGYCFHCAEEMACLLAAEGLEPRSAWHRRACHRAKPCLDGGSR